MLREAIFNRIIVINGFRFRGNDRLAAGVRESGNLFPIVNFSIIMDSRTEQNHI